MADCTMTPETRAAADWARSSTARDLAAPWATLKANMERTRMTERVPKTRMKPMTSCTPRSSLDRARSGRRCVAASDGEAGVDAGMEEAEGEAGAGGRRAGGGAGQRGHVLVAHGAHAVAGDLGAGGALRRVQGRRRLRGDLRVAVDQRVAPGLGQR